MADNENTRGAAAAGEREPGRRRPRWRLWVALAAGVAAVAAATAVATRSGGAPDAGRALARAGAQAAAADAYRVRVSAVDRLSVSGPEVAGDEPTTREVLEADVRGTDWRAQIDRRTGVGDAVRIDGALWTRGVYGDGPGAAAGWEREQEEPDADPTARLRELVSDPAVLALRAGSTGDPGVPTFDDVIVPLLGWWYLGTVGEPSGGRVGATPVALPEPAGLAGALAALDHPRVVDRLPGGGLTVRGTRSAPAALAAEAGRPLPDGNFEVDLDAAGRPQVLRLTVTGAHATHDVVVSWSDWNAPDIAVAPPDSPAGAPQ